MIVELAEHYQTNPAAREAAQLLSPCVQCGQCTVVCPTFRLLDDEWDGPRGRIFLIKRFLEGKEPDPNFISPAYDLSTLAGRTIGENLQLHLDRCLTCRSCETSCPQQVRYGRLLDLARDLVEAAVPRPWRMRIARRLTLGIVSHRRRFAMLLRVGQALKRHLPQAWRELVPPPASSTPWPGRTHARRMLVWQGCVQPALAPGINAAAARVLDRLGIQLIPAGDGCCGSLHQHLAEKDLARAFMRRSIDMLWPHIHQGVEALVVTASGCGSFFRDYGTLLEDDPAYGRKARHLAAITRDIAEVVSEAWPPGAEPTLPVAAQPLRVAFQSSCSLQHGERLNGVVEALLRRAGFKLVPVQYPFMCCGAAGTYAILQRPLARRLRAQKLKTLLPSKPAVIATANVGCLAHLGSVAPVPVCHWIELLDQRFTEASSASACARPTEAAEVA